MQDYEDLLGQDLQWALKEGSVHFERGSALHNALRKIVQRFDEHGISYAIAGAMALFVHGVRRFTEDVDILVTPEGLKQIHDHLEGRGYVAPFSGSRNLRDAESGVRIEFLVTGEYPGDGKPKPVAFPEPGKASTVIDGVHFLSLPRLIELKLASGMTNPLRIQDLADAQRLIQDLALPADLARELSPFVQEKYRELWEIVQRHFPDVPD